jgi:hypothetical protein
VTPFREAPVDILTERNASKGTGSLSNVSYNVSLTLSDDPALELTNQCHRKRAADTRVPLESVSRIAAKTGQC